ncbi:nucleotidyl transferase AbiEii/AbiGii toxin family protein [Candidatus Gottesmanbacteria bacterium]|nr:nucleotidyl transferase AbiEii/AbiGii toxin family protein [Candidatus Gottesmanbacteria bacterium]
MIILKLKNILNLYQAGHNSLFVRSALKEALQDYVLNFVYNDHKYKTMIFTGGTCLRKIYGLPRLSEDVDFDFVGPPAGEAGSFDIEDFAAKATAYFMKELQYKDITATVSGGGQTVFLKFPVLRELGVAKHSGDSPILFVRCDFSKETIGVFTTEVNSVSTEEFSFFVLSYDLPTLFANKITAFLERNFFKGKEQAISFKGRDLFDLVWFLEKSKKSDWKLKPNWDRLTKGLSIDNSNEIAALIIKKVESIDKKDVQRDLLPFIESPQMLKNFTDNFASVIKENIKNVI